MPRTTPKHHSGAQDSGWQPSLPEPRYSQSFERGLAILRCFTPKRQELGIVDLADELGMSRATTHRYVVTLQTLGYLEQVKSRKYRLARKANDIGAAALRTAGLSDLAQDDLHDLRRRTGFTADIAVLYGREIMLVDRARSFRQVEGMAHLGPGARLPAYCTAMGKLLLAFLPDAEQRTLIAGMSLIEHGPNTITKKEALRGELRAIRAKGLAVDDEELAADLYCMSAPLVDEARQVIAAVGVAAPTSAISLPMFVRTCRPHLAATATTISARLSDGEPG